MGGGRRGRRAIEARRRARQRLRALAAAVVALTLIVAIGIVAANREAPVDPAALPKEVVAIRDEVALEVRTLEDNAPVRTLVDVGPKDDPKAQLVDLTVPDDRSVAYFVQADPDGVNVRRVALDGGPSTVIAPGTNPAVSKNGRKLAYLEPEAAALVIRDTRTGKDRRWTPAPEVDLPERTTVFDYAMSWSPDGRHLAFALIDPDEVFVLDTEDPAATLAAAKRIGPPDEANRAAWSQPIYRPDGQLLVLQTCCVEGTDQPLLLVDDETGDVKGTERQIDHEVDRFDYSQGGSHLIYVTPINEVYRATGRGKQTLVAKDTNAVAW